jgi:DNA-binding IscR family transcriptional regulator
MPMWERLEKMIDEFFEGITIADLLEENGQL